MPDSQNTIFSDLKYRHKSLLYWWIFFFIFSLAINSSWELLRIKQWDQNNVVKNYILPTAIVVYACINSFITFKAIMIVWKFFKLKRTVSELQRYKLINTCIILLCSIFLLSYVIMPNVRGYTFIAPTIVLITQILYIFKYRKLCSIFSH